MLYYFLTCRSLTYAQRSAKVLERAGITASIRRTPKGIAKEGCGYSVKVSSRNLAPSIQQLDRLNLIPDHIFLADGNGDYREVFM